MKEVQAKIEDATRDRLPIDQYVLFVQVPASWSDQQHCRLRVELVGFTLRACEGDGAADGIAHIDLSLNSRIPCWRVSVFKICHKYFSARIKRVNHHLAVNRASNLCTTIQQISWQRGNRPVSLAHMSRL